MAFSDQDILKSKLSEVEALLAYFKQAVTAEKDISKDTAPDGGDNNETQNNDERVPPIMTDTRDEVTREPFKALFYDKKEILSLKEAYLKTKKILLQRCQINLLLEKFFIFLRRKTNHL